MTNILDILINEVANVLNISPEEVKQRFTKSELDELLANSLCEPIDEVGPPLGSISDIPCAEPAPKFLEDVPLDELAKIEEEALSILKKDNTKKCIDQVEEVNQVISKQIEEYNNHKLLYEKLLEYRDNYSAIALYFTERSKEAARVMGEFTPLLQEIRRLESAKTEYNNELNRVNAETVKYGSNIPKHLTDKKNEIYKNIQTVDRDIAKQQSILSLNEKKYSIFSDVDYLSIKENLKNETGSVDYIYYLQRLINRYLDDSTFKVLDSQFEKYSQLINSRVNIISPISVQQLVENNYFKFNLKFIQLNSLTIPKEIFNKETGTSTTIDVNFPIKNNPILQKNSFFKTSSIFSLTEYQLPVDIPPTGKIYTNYYNLFKDPINNFFSLDERGLTTNINLIDPKVKGTSSDRKREGNIEYFVSSVDTLQNFYEEFDSRFETRKKEKHSQIVDPAKESLRIVIKSIVKKEIQLIFALNGVNFRLPEDSSTFKSTIARFKSQNDEFATGLADLDSEISRINKRLVELKPEPEKIKEVLRKKSPDCFDKADPVEQKCPDTKSKLGSDPLFIKTLSEGADPTLPNQNQLCYWKEFSKIINKVGLLPVPNVSLTPELRYWPVGIIIPYPGGLIKIPLPIIWIPLIVISTPLGNIVIFLTVNGLFISPVIFFVSNTGFKQHIITAKGSSKQFGYSAQDQLIKPGIIAPLGVLALAEKAERLAKEAINGKYAHLSKEDFENLQKTLAILAAAEASAIASGNVNRLLKTTNEKLNLLESKENLGKNEKLSNMLDRVDSAKDIIYDAKRSIHKQIDKLGSVNLSASEIIKSKIVERREKLVADLKKALEDNDLEKAESIRLQLETDGFDINSKIEAIISDMKKQFDKIKFPKITIPKDFSTIDPKQNAIFELIKIILDFSSKYGTQFFGPDNLQVRLLILTEIGKHKEELLEIAEPIAKYYNKIRIDDQLEDIQDALSKISKKLIDKISGIGTEGTIQSIQAKIDDLDKQISAETDPINRKKLRIKKQKEQKKLSNLYDSTRIKEFLALTPLAISKIADVSVDLNPFAPCCAKPQFKLDLTDLGPATAIFKLVESLLLAYVSTLTVSSLSLLFGGKKEITPNDLINSLISIIKNTIPESIVIPVPGLNLLTLAKSFAKTLMGLLDPKAPIPAVLPALPAPIVIDLNILKQPLLELLIAFLLDCLPDKNKTTVTVTEVPGQNRQLSSASNSTSNQNTINTASNLDNSINIVTCETDDSQNSVLSGGNIGTSNQQTSTSSQEISIGSSSSSYITSTSSQGNVILDFPKDILPSFQTLDIDFLSINSSDFTAILRNFVDLKFDAVIAIIDPFYNLLNTIKAAHGATLNIIEAAQHQTPPYGQISNLAFTAVTKLKQAALKSLSFGIINPDLAKEKLLILEKVLGPICNTPLPAVIVASAGAADAILPTIKMPTVDIINKSFSTQDMRVATSALRQLHPLLNQDDLPPWERLSSKNLLFLLFVDEFIATAADQVGFFRSYV